MKVRWEIIGVYCENSEKNELGELMKYREFIKFYMKGGEL